jgi:hypothetical protein
MNLFILGRVYFDFKNRPDELDEFIYTAEWKTYGKHMNTNNLI